MGLLYLLSFPLAILDTPIARDSAGHSHRSPNHKTAPIQPDRGGFYHSV